MFVCEEFSYEQYLAMRSAMRIRLVLKAVLLENSITHVTALLFHLTDPFIAVLKPQAKLDRQ